MKENLGSQREKATDPHLKRTDGERERHRERETECVEWEASMTQRSRKISTEKSIWEWVRLTLTPNVQPVMSWEESSWQRIRVLETHIHRGSEIHSSAHLKDIHTQDTDQHAQACRQTSQTSFMCNGGSYAHSEQHCASILSDIHASPDINRLPWSSRIRQIHFLIWLQRAEHSHEVVRKTCTRVTVTEGEDGKHCAVEKSVTVSLGKLQVTDCLIHFLSMLISLFCGQELSQWHYDSLRSKLQTIKHSSL